MTGFLIALFDRRLIEKKVSPLHPIEEMFTNESIGIGVVLKIQYVLIAHPHYIDMIEDDLKRFVFIMRNDKVCDNAPPVRRKADDVTETTPNWRFLRYRNIERHVPLQKVWSGDLVTIHYSTLTAD